MTQAKTLGAFLEEYQISHPGFSESILLLNIIFSERICPLSFIPWFREVGIQDLMSIDKDLLSDYTLASNAHIVFSRTTKNIYEVRLEPND